MAPAFKQPNYRPLCLSWFGMVSLLVYMCSLAALLEYATRVLPSAEHRTFVPKKNADQPPCLDSLNGNPTTCDNAIIQSKAKRSAQERNVWAAANTTGSNEVARTTSVSATERDAWKQTRRPLTAVHAAGSTRPSAKFSSLDSFKLLKRAELKKMELNETAFANLTLDQISYFSWHLDWSVGVYHGLLQDTEDILVVYLPVGYTINGLCPGGREVLVERPGADDGKFGLGAQDCEVTHQGDVRLWKDASCLNSFEKHSKLVNQFQKYPNSWWVTGAHFSPEGTGSASVETCNSNGLGLGHSDRRSEPLGAEEITWAAFSGVYTSYTFPLGPAISISNETPIDGRFWWEAAFASEWEQWDSTRGQYPTRGYSRLLESPYKYITPIPEVLKYLEPVTDTPKSPPDSTSSSASPSIATPDMGQAELYTSLATMVGPAAVVTSIAPGSSSTYTTSTTILLTNYAHWEAPSIMTLTDAFGEPTKTLTNSPAGLIRSETTQTIFRSDGIATATVTTKAPIATVVVYDPPGHNRTRMTVTEYLTFPLAGSPQTGFRSITLRDYIVGTFLPVVLATIMSIWIEAVNKNVKLLLPFQALTRAGGTSAADSICLDTSGLNARLNSFRLLFCFKEPLSLLSDLLEILCAILVAVSSEAVGMKLHGACSDTDFKGCTMTLGVFLGPARAIEILLLFTASILCAFIFAMIRFRSGVAVAPWSVGSIASLFGDDKVRQVIRSLRFGMARYQIGKRQMIEHMAGYTFTFKHSKPHNHYSIMAVKTPLTELRHWSDIIDEQIPDYGKMKKDWRARLRRAPMAKKQAVFLLLLCSLLAVILYYKNTRFDTAFERFMDDQHFGVRFLFTTLGVCITFFWDMLFSKFSMRDPYRRLANRSQLAMESILLTPDTSPFASLPRAVLRGDTPMAAVALATIFAKASPLLLSNIPFRITQTWMTHVVTAWMTVAVLCYMILVIIMILTLRWPYMPVEPDTIAGSVYYVCDSFLLLDFQGMAMLSNKQRRVEIEKGGIRYKYGEIFGLSGKTRIGIDYAQDALSLHREFVD